MFALVDAAVPTEKGKTMKWLKKYKQDIIDGVLFFVIMHTMLWGFWFSYMMVCKWIGLPITYRSICIALALAVLSLVGFCNWCAKG